MQIKQTQKLSPQMIQNMEILQMSSLELQEYVEKALLENPVLEWEEGHDHEDAGSLLRRMEWLHETGRRSERGGGPDAGQGMEPVAVQPGQEGLCEHLRDQISPRGMTREMRLAVEAVLSGLDTNGYLEETPEELAGRSGLPVPAVEAALKLVQGLEPAGVGARNLSQCLALQLERRGEEDGLAMTIVREHLEDMAGKRYHRIAQQTGADRAAVQRACQEIRSLDPRPGAAYAPSQTPGYLWPDLLVRLEDGRPEVTLNGGALPELRISGYYQQLRGECGDPQVKSYLEDKIRQACWVMKGIEQRRTTLLRCGRSIAARQEDFFLRGPACLRPMSLADVAADVGVHESTVSRAVREKYLQCSFGVFPLSRFFSRALSGPAGEEVSPEQARAAIRALIQEEDRRHPLSDQKLCDLLAGQEIFLARRTVAKYRQSLGIPVAGERREC